jgi:hypothetical protein
MFITIPCFSIILGALSAIGIIVKLVIYYFTDGYLPE